MTENKDMKNIGLKYCLTIEETLKEYYNSFSTIRSTWIWYNPHFL